MESVFVTCPNCGTPAGGWKVENGQAHTRCDQCGTAISVSVENALSSRLPDPTHTIPEGMEVENQTGVQAGRWKATYHWKGAQAGSLVITAFPLLLISVAALVLFRSSPLQGTLLALLAALWAALGYAFLVQFVNRTHFQIDGESLRVRHGPLPWRMGRTLPVGSIVQLYCRQQKAFETLQQGVYDHGMFYRHSGMKKNATVVFSYRLYAALRGGKRIALTGPIMRPDQALFLERTLENQLKLKDFFVPGEVDR